jgi:CRP-like cAMP-binding protein
MGCVQTKKLNDSQIFKANFPQNQINNSNQNNINNHIKEDEKINTKINLNKETENNQNEKEINDKGKENLEIQNSNIKSTKENIIKKSEYNKKIAKEEISEEDKIKIKNALENHFLFKNKDQKIISNIIDLLEIQKLPPNTTLFNKGDKGNYFYIIKKGKLELIAEYGKKILNQDETFGELALIENKERTATVKSIDYCILYLLNGKLFREIVSQINEGELLERLNFLKAISIFSILDNVHLNSIALGMIKCEFEKGQMILYEVDIGQSIYIINYGSVKSLKEKKKLDFYTKRFFFGKSSFI